MGKRLILTILLAIISLTAFSQVTIGTDAAPMEGALLQIKSLQVSDASPNATQGLLLPRVQFDAAASASGNLAQKLVASLKLSLPSGATVDAPAHTGLMVYNMSDVSVSSGAPFADGKICPGVYIWDGSQWVRLMAKDCL